jgi:hypothetical protein
LHQQQKGILIFLRDELAPLETTRDSIATAIYATLSRLIENKTKHYFGKKTQISFSEKMSG